jgi:DNA-binding NarL/FixJ family response regulator
MTIYRYVPSRPVQTIAAESAGEDRILQSVLRQYLQSLHKRDPFQPFLAPSKQPQFVLCSIDADDIEDHEFRDRLYRPFGMAGKMSLIVRRPDDAISVSFFRGRDSGAFRSSEISHIESLGETLAACVERHLVLQAPFHRHNVSSLVGECEAFPCESRLSSREANVCARVIAGWTTEAIALDLSISFHSVVTYKRRAYGKLGICSKSELFALLLSSRNSADSGDHLLS